MIEQKKIKKQFIGNILIIFIIFLSIFLLFDVIIFNQVSNILFKNIDIELKSTVKEYKEIVQKEKNIVTQLTLEKVIRNNNMAGPRLIYIIRDENGNVINESSIGRLYEDYIETISFDKNEENNIYNIKINNKFNFRGITTKVIDVYGNTIFVQLLANVDAEIGTISNLSKILIIGTSVIVAIAMMASYILAKKTLNPIIKSWKKQTEFVQNASHELRTPLTIIQAKQELLLQEPNSKILEKSQDINISLQETRRLSKMIKELMMLSLDDSNKLMLNKEKQNLDNLIQDIIIPYQDFAKMQKKEFELDLGCKNEINIDKEKISQLIVILLDNAIKYTKEKDIIKIKTYQKSGRTIIEVKDTGIGMSKEGMKRAFERFYREDEARTRTSGGTGLRIINCKYNSKTTWRKYKTISK